MDKCPVCGNDDEERFFDYTVGEVPVMEGCYNCGVVQLKQEMADSVDKDDKN